MLIIGHRGARGLAPENSLEALEAGFAAGADILEFDVRVTRDNVPVVIHDRHTKRTHEVKSVIASVTLAELKKLGLAPEISTLDKVLQRFYGHIILNIELKSPGSGVIVVNLLRKKYIRKPADWDNVLLSSFLKRELRAVARLEPRANLALLQWLNPLGFITFHRQIPLTAVGFHRLHVNAFVIELCRQLGIFTYAYTVNRVESAKKLSRRGIDGIVTDYPDRITNAFADSP